MMVPRVAWFEDAKEGKTQKRLQCKIPWDFKTFILILFTIAGVWIFVG